MIIVLFHVIYLIGKIVYENYRYTGLGNTTEPKSNAPVYASESASNNKRPRTDPFDAYDDEDEDKSIKSPKFSPPAYIQRYLAVIQVLTDPRYGGKIKKVVDFGCSELAFVTYLKNAQSIEEILCVDIDRDTLERHKYKAIPLNADYIKGRERPLKIHVYEGSVAHSDNALANCDAVVAIELIEHLYPQELMELPRNVFGFVKPLIAVFTTPNAEFNILFANMKSRYRHWDHKFEWTREQFQDWARNIVSGYPEYEVSFEGIGAGPPGSADLGCCSQMAIFRRTRESPMSPTYGREGLLKKVTSEEFPYRLDNRSDEEKILDEASYRIRSFAQYNPEGSFDYPLSSLMRDLANFCATEESVREILVNGNWVIVDGPDGPMIQCPDASTFSDYELDVNDLEDATDGWASPGEQDDRYVTRVERDYEDEECWDDNYEVTVASSINSSQEEPRLALVSDARFSSSWSHMDSPNAFSRTVENSSQADAPDIVTWNDRISRITKLDGNHPALGSMVSICLESSRNEQDGTCPRDITNPSFDCTELQRSFDEETRETELRRDENSRAARRTPLEKGNDLGVPRSSSSPRDHLQDPVDSPDSPASRSERQKTPGSLSVRRSYGCVETPDGRHQCPSTRTNGTSRSVADSSNAPEEFRVQETKGTTIPDKVSSPDTPPGSWSPEIVDSGYPNTSSIQDTTPEYDLSSIGQDSNSDPESPSVAEVRHLAPAVDSDEDDEVELNNDEVQNGDLANNNRDDEGNNIADEPEELQPLIAVLEEDLENENDIYAIENDFPLWLPRILERGGNVRIAERVLADQREAPLNVNAAGDSGIPDEGFDTSSSENDDDHNDDEDVDNAYGLIPNDEDDDVSVGGGEETLVFNTRGSRP